MPGQMFPTPTFSAVCTTTLSRCAQDPASTGQVWEVGSQSLMMMMKMMMVVVVTETMNSRPSKGGRKVGQRSVKITDQGPESQRVPSLQLPGGRRCVHFIPSAPRILQWTGGLRARVGKFQVSFLFKVLPSLFNFKSSLVMQSVQWNIYYDKTNTMDAERLLFCKVQPTGTKYSRILKRY